MTQSNTEVCPDDDAGEELPEAVSIADNLRGKHIMLSGGTGYLGMVALSLLLHRHPDVGQVYLLIRHGKYDTAQERFWADVAASECLDPVRSVYSDGYAEFIRKKVTVLEGDVTLDNVGLTKRQLTRLRSRLDLVISCAGLVDFRPPLTDALEINTRGPVRMLDLARSCKHAAFAHVSTCYVTGTRDGDITEECPYGFYPNEDELHMSFDPEREIADCDDFIANVRKEAHSQERLADFTKRARAKLREANVSPDQVDALERTRDKEQRDWISTRLREEGNRRAKHWGWTNTYTYTKSLGEQLISRHKDELPVAIIRPSVVESAISYPTKSWNQGVNTTAGITYITYNGMRFVPVDERGAFDMVPVDYVANSILAVGAFLIAGQHDFVYQVATSQRNPLWMPRCVELMDLAHRTHYMKRVSSPRWKNLLMTAITTVPVTKKRYESFSAPGVRKWAQRVSDLARRGAKQAPPLRPVLKSIDEASAKIEKQTRLIEMIFDVYMPFVHDHRFVFHAHNLEKIQARLPEHEKSWGFTPEDICWRDYWLNIHMPGMHRYVFPLLEEKLKRHKKPFYTYEDLTDLFTASTENFGRRVAMQRLTEEGIERYTYRDLQERAHRVRTLLHRRGLSKGQRVLIASENRPEWGMSYFGIVEAEGTAVPVDSELRLAEILNLARSCQAFGLIASDDVRARLEEEGLEQELATLDVEEGQVAEAQWRPADLRVLSFAEIFDPELSTAEPDPASTALVRRPWATDEVASLIYTSGTTGTPKGVMLSHGNFTSLLASVNQVFRITERDAFLSVLPLHHTFEFTAGLLMPLSRGSSITYLDELSSEALQRAFRDTKVTAMIGVPALWQLLNRRVSSEVNRRGPRARMVFDALVTLNRWLRNRFKINAGRLLFRPVHAKFGGQIRYLISGGASLPVPIMETFHGLGFHLLEGYGLTEAAPVLTCGRPGDPVKPGSVGRALPDVDVKILNPDPAGVGEIIARGGNVMLGYWDNERATDAVMTEDGWLRTGDLGRLDSKGFLTIAGRQKEVIVAANGENVYPDELEEHFDGHEFIEELSVVGLPDDQGSERVACLVRITEDAIDELGWDDAVAKTRKHIDVQNSRLSNSHRVSVLRFTADELPRTATRKIRRKAVLELLKEMKTDGDVAGATYNWAQWGWLRELAAQVVGRKTDTVGIGSSMADDLGYDSLTFVELATSIEKRTGRAITSEDLIAAGTLGATIALLESADALRSEAVSETSDEADYGSLPAAMRPQGVRRPAIDPTSVGDAFEVPGSAKETLRSLLGMSQTALYRDMFDVKVIGRTHIPYHTHAIVCANHSSHLDMGLVKYALRDWAPELATLAASDYFFDTKAKRTYFGQFTNLIPMERTGGLEKSMAEAVGAVKNGKPVLLFPEGTRSITGQLSEFRQALGYLAMETKSPILPIYLGGTYRALPKGSVLPRKRRLTVHVGELIEYDYFEERTRGMAFRDACTEVSRLSREAVEALRKGKRFLDEDSAEPNPKEAALRRLFRHLEGRFVARQVDQDVSFYFSLGGDETEKWTVKAGAESCTASQGKPLGGRADCVVKTTPDFFRKMVMDSYTPSIDEFLSGKIKTSDPSLLIAFQNIFGF